jgi:hypothetical protein
MSDRSDPRTVPRPPTYRPAALVLCVGVLASLLATGALDWAFAQLISGTPLFIERPGVALVNFLVLAAPFGLFAARGADIDPLDQPKRALGLLAGSLVGTWVALMLYGYLLITTFLTPSLGVEVSLNLWAEGLMVLAPVLVFTAMHAVGELVGAEA